MLNSQGTHMPGGGGGGAAGGRKPVTIYLTKNVHMHTLSQYCTVAGARFRYPVPILMTARGPQDTLCYYWWPQEGHKIPCANIDDRKIIPCPAARPRHLQYGSAPPPPPLIWEQNAKSLKPVDNRLVLTRDKEECRPNPITYKYSNGINRFTGITNIGTGLIFFLCCSDIWNMIMKFKMAD